MTEASPNHETTPNLGTTPNPPNLNTTPNRDTPNPDASSADMLEVTPRNETLESSSDNPAQPTEDPESELRAGADDVRWTKDKKLTWWTQRVDERVENCSPARRELLIKRLASVMPGKPRSESFRDLKDKIHKLEALANAKESHHDWNLEDIEALEHRVERIDIEAYAFAKPYTSEKGDGLLANLKDMGIIDGKDHERVWTCKFPSHFVAKCDPCAYTVQDWQTRVRQEKASPNSRSWTYKISGTSLCFQSKTGVRRPTFEVLGHEIWSSPNMTIKPATQAHIDQVSQPLKRKLARYAPRTSGSKSQPKSRSKKQKTNETAFQKNTDRNPLDSSSEEEDDIEKIEDPYLLRCKIWEYRDVKSIARQEIREKEDVIQSLTDDLEDAQQGRALATQDIIEKETEQAVAIWKRELEHERQRAAEKFERLQADVVKKDDEIKTLRRQIEQLSPEELAKKDAVISELNITLAAQLKDISEANVAIDNMQIQLREKDTAILEKDTAIREKDTALEEMKVELAKRSATTTDDAVIEQLREERDAEENNAVQRSEQCAAAAKTYETILAQLKATQDLVVTGMEALKR